MSIAIPPRATGMCRGFKLLTICAAVFALPPQLCQIVPMTSDEPRALFSSGVYERTTLVPWEATMEVPFIVILAIIVWWVGREEKMRSKA
jgi:hypothetical protein